MGVPVADRNYPSSKSGCAAGTGETCLQCRSNEDCVGKTDDVWEYTDGVRVTDVLAIELCVGVGVGVGAGCWVAVVVRALEDGVGIDVDSVEEVEGGGGGDFG